MVHLYRSMRGRPLTWDMSMPTPRQPRILAAATSTRPSPQPTSRTTSPGASCAHVPGAGSARRRRAQSRQHVRNGPVHGKRGGEYAAGPRTESERGHARRGGARKARGECAARGARERGARMWQWGGCTERSNRRGWKGGKRHVGERGRWAVWERQGTMPRSGGDTTA